MRLESERAAAVEAARQQAEAELASQARIAAENEEQRQLEAERTRLAEEAQKARATATATAATNGATNGASAGADQVRARSWQIMLCFCCCRRHRVVLQHAPRHQSLALCRRFLSDLA